ARTQLERPVGVLIVERLPLQTGDVVDFKVAIIEEHHVGGGLAGNPFAYRAMAGVIVYRITLRVRVNVIASANVFVGHGSSSLGVEVESRRSYGRTTHAVTTPGHCIESSGISRELVMSRAPFGHRPYLCLATDANCVHGRLQRRA